MFAAETYDAGASIAASLVAVSGGAVSGGTPAAGRDAEAGGQPASDAAGQPCTTYKDCTDALRDGKRPDYDGQSGRINFDAHGDITEANYAIYTYSEDNL